MLVARRLSHSARAGMLGSGNGHAHPAPFERAPGLDFNFNFNFTALLSFTVHKSYSCQLAIFSTLSTLPIFL